MTVVCFLHGLSCQVTTSALFKSIYFESPSFCPWFRDNSRVYCDTSSGHVRQNKTSKNESMVFSCCVGCGMEQVKMMEACA